MRSITRTFYLEDSQRNSFETFELTEDIDPRNRNHWFIGIGARSVVDNWTEQVTSVFYG